MNEQKREGRGNCPTPPYPEQHQISPGLKAAVEPQPMWRAPHSRPATKLENKIAKE
jgi:hypothetical protein